MKKFLVLFVAVLLALPAVSFAGSATSRWDLTLGGYVKFDLVYADKAVGVDNRVSPVDKKGGFDTGPDKTGSLTWGDAETRLNWLVKGPDAWGAKTSAFVEGDFRAASPSRGTTNNGEFGLRHAFLKLDWPTTSLLVGHTWQAWGMIPTLNILAFAEEHFNKGATRVPQIRLTQKFGGFAVAVAAQSPYDVLTTNNVGNDPRANSLIPDLVLDFSYGSNCLGKIGPFGLKVGVGGFWGKDKYLWKTAATAASIEDETVDRYGAGLYWFVPIIPEKKEGDKAMALAFTGQLFAGKGMSTYLPGYTNPALNKPHAVVATQVYANYAGFPGAYNRRGGHALIRDGVTVSDTGFDPAYYMTNGGWVQGTFYFTNKLFTNVVYGAEYNRVSSAFKSARAAAEAVPERIQNFVVNVMYDVNPAIRFGIEYDWVNTAYAYRETATSSNNGSFNSIRVGAYYFF